MTTWNLDHHTDTPSGTARWTAHGTGDPVVLLHGTPFSSRVWHDTATALAAHHTVYLWDMPGYGTSARHPGQDVSLAAQQRAFTTLLRHWDLDHPTVIAHDFGGAVALRTHLLDGIAYRRLALIDAVALRPWGSDFFRLVHDHADVFTALPAHLHDALVRAYITTATRTPPRADLLDDLTAPWRGPDGQAAFYRQIAQADQEHTHEIEDRYADLDLPVLIAWGRDDTWLPPDHARRLAAAIPGAHLHWIDGAGHLVQHDAPARLTALLTDFLSR
ncbi:alpha/beta fold hydrolase [Nocardiopsis trehalosi]|jgi:pimeloyl-ACP methyl ester carboxylesterase|uniref:alpha/beta fold hydrolase n=1 Tax=Nocardiopsis trehalosi TaxID=109329 RepID=UPI000832772F|nr:alpha/beta fold hydrolase [Nocardiopsis trehalosi]